MYRNYESCYNQISNNSGCTKINKNADRRSCPNKWSPCLKSVTGAKWGYTYEFGSIHRNRQQFHQCREKPRKNVPNQMGWQWNLKPYGVEKVIISI